MKEMEYSRIGETAVWKTLPNGLPVCVIRKPGYTRKYAFFATHYGGMDLRFQLDGRWLDTPAGIAHYLEHKMFDTEDGNALQELAKNGAEPNAFTSNAMTGYYFDSTEHFEENLGEHTCPFGEHYAIEIFFFTNKVSMVYFYLFIYFILRSFRILVILNSASKRPWCISCAVWITKAKDLFLFQKINIFLQNLGHALI